VKNGFGVAVMIAFTIAFVVGGMWLKWSFCTATGVGGAAFLGCLIR
jgi:hypothetical protein